MGVESHTCDSIPRCERGEIRFGFNHLGYRLNVESLTTEQLRWCIYENNNLSERQHKHIVDIQLVWVVFVWFVLLTDLGVLVDFDDCSAQFFPYHWVKPSCTETCSARSIFWCRIAVLNLFVATQLTIAQRSWTILSELSHLLFMCGSDSKYA